MNNEEQQKAINEVKKAAREAVIAAYAKDELFAKDNPSDTLRIRVSESIRGYEKRVLSSQIDAKKLGVTDNDVIWANVNEQDQTKKSIKSGELKSEIEQMKSVLIKGSVTPPQHVIRSAEEKKPELAKTEPKEAPDNLAYKKITLNHDEQALVAQLKEYKLPNEIKGKARIELIKEHPDFSDKDREAIVIYSYPTDDLDIFRKIEKKSKDNETYSKILDTVQDEIYKEIKDGKHNKEINKVKEDILGMLKEPLIKKSREALQQVASGKGGYDTLVETLEELEKKYGLKAEVLDPNFDYKDPKKQHKTTKQMEAMLDSSIKNWRALYEAKLSLGRMRDGIDNVEESIKRINEHLSSAGFGYDALDKDFDPSNPSAPHRTAQEMKEEIKATVHDGNKAREKRIQHSEENTKFIIESQKSIMTIDPYLYPKKYDKPDYNLDLDKLLNLEEKKVSSRSNDDNKFAAILEGVKVSPLTLANTTSFISSLPSNGKGHAIT